MSTDPSSLPRVDAVQGLTVADVMHADVETFPPAIRVEELRAWFAESASRRLAVIADDGRYVAALTPTDLGDAAACAFAVEFARRRPTIAPDEPAATGARRVVATETRRIAVVDAKGDFHGVLAVTSDLRHFACRPAGR